jgi:hypothetical protein
MRGFVSRPSLVVGLVVCVLGLLSFGVYQVSADPPDDSADLELFDVPQSEDEEAVVDELEDEMGEENFEALPLDPTTLRDVTGSVGGESLTGGDVERYSVATDTGRTVICLEAEVGPEEDVVRASTCQSPEAFSATGLALVVERRSDPADPLVPYVAVLAPDGYSFEGVDGEVGRIDNFAVLDVGSGLPASVIADATSGSDLTVAIPVPDHSPPE